MPALIFVIMEKFKKRKNLRLKDYDYSSGGSYFITICTLDKKCILARIVGADDLGSPNKRLSKYGIIVDKNIKKMMDIYKDIDIKQLCNYAKPFTYSFNG